MRRCSTSGALAADSGVGRGSSGRPSRRSPGRCSLQPSGALHSIFDKAGWALIKLAGAPGFEPGNGGIKIRCLTTWLRPIGCVCGLSRRLLPASPLPDRAPCPGLAGVAAGPSGREVPYVDRRLKDFGARPADRNPRRPGAPHSSARRRPTTTPARRARAAACRGERGGAIGEQRKTGRAAAAHPGEQRSRQPGQAIEHRARFRERASAPPRSGRCGGPPAPRPARRRRAASRRTGRPP